MNGGIRRKLMEVENPPASIEQWYKRATALDRNCRESRREEEVSVDDVLSYRTALGIPDVHPNHRLVRFGGHFDNTRF